MNYRKLFLTALVILLLAPALTGVADEQGREYADQAFKRGLVTFAVARTLNGVISVAQGTEVAVEPAGVGVNFAVGQILDPVNDLVERFSAVMLVATSSLGLQNILLRMSAWWGISAALVIAAAAFILALWLPADIGRKFLAVAIRVLTITVFLRFAMPLLVMGTNAVFDTFLAAEQAQATQALEAASQEIESLNAENASRSTDDNSLVGRLGEIWDDSMDSINVKDKLEDFRGRMSNASEHIINLIVIFVLQTIILPLVFVWLIADVLKYIASRAAGMGAAKA